MVFPSVTDTFGLVMAEAMACGTPIAAYPVPGPIDVVGQSAGGVLHADLGAACLEALKLPRDAVRRHAERYSWAAATDQILSALQPIGSAESIDGASTASESALLENRRS
jgi:glycosyltransferase involved in cell wall biosynthesis